MRRWLSHSEGRGCCHGNPEEHHCVTRIRREMRVQVLRQPDTDGNPDPRAHPHVSSPCRLTHQGLSPLSTPIISTLCLQFTPSQATLPLDSQSTSPWSLETASRYQRGEGRGQLPASPRPLCGNVAFFSGTAEVRSQEEYSPTQVGVLHMAGVRMDPTGPKTAACWADRPLDLMLQEP